MRKSCPQGGYVQRGFAQRHFICKGHPNGHSESLNTVCLTQTLVLTH